MNAIINQVEGRVEFLDGGTNDIHTVQELEKRLKQCIQLHGQLSEANRQISTDARYIQKVGVVGGVVNHMIYYCCYRVVVRE